MPCNEEGPPREQNVGPGRRRLRGAVGQDESAAGGIAAMPTLLSPAAALARLLLAIAALLLATGPARSEPSMDDSLSRVRQEWAVVCFQVPAEKRADVLDTLVDMAHQVTARFPDRAEPLVWEGMVLAAYADVRGPLLGYFAARRARELLLEAERRDPGGLGSIPYATLGMLYARALPRPLSFGDPAIARVYLDKALSVYPQSMEANLLYGQFLLERGDYSGAAYRLRQALAAPPSTTSSNVAVFGRSQALRLLAQAQGRS